MLSYKVLHLRTLLPHLATTGTAGEPSEGDSNGVVAARPADVCVVGFDILDIV